MRIPAAARRGGSHVPTATDAKEAPDAGRAPRVRDPGPRVRDGAARSSEPGPNSAWRANPSRAGRVCDRPFDSCISRLMLHNYVRAFVGALSPHSPGHPAATPHRHPAVICPPRCTQSLAGPVDAICTMPHPITGPNKHLAVPLWSKIQDGHVRRRAGAIVPVHVDNAAAGRVRVAGSAAQVATEPGACSGDRSGACWCAGGTAGRGTRDWRGLPKPNRASVRTGPAEGIEAVGPAN